MAAFRTTSRRWTAFCGGIPLRATTYPHGYSLAKVEKYAPRMSVALPARASPPNVKAIVERARSRTVMLFKKPPSESGGSGGSGSRWGGGSGYGGGGGDGEERNGLQKLIAAYINAQERRPIFTKASSTLVLTMIGDYCAQRLSARQSGERFTLDLRRMLSVGTFGFCFMGPVLHYWYGTLDRIFGRSAIQKMISDQLLFSIPFNSSFIIGVGLLEGGSLSDVTTSVRDKWWTTAKANWCLWPAAQMINFSLVPKSFQIIYVNSVGFVWNVVLTYIAHSKIGSKTDNVMAIAN